MNIKNMMILSPSTLTFQAPFPFYQKRQLSLLNLSEKIMVYSIEVDDQALYEVMPLSGVLATYCTIEVTILIKPVSGNMPASMLTVRYMEKPENSSGNLPTDWSGAFVSQVGLLLMNCVADDEELMRLADSDGDPDVNDVLKRLERYKPVCTNCCLKRSNCNQAKESKAWLRPLLWSACLAALSAGG
ncbi:hypothetical protein KR093_010738 [Drosophila rubida]|uniref:MSP domain-containing protein n=1 Tax=Drosophila rubida TaxID=30044 RepID=A0AAD4K7J9_9MUSC|nr:hypothetical protein KR093_010738 [Drosophila rubida]